ncbi:MAG: alpha/beta fold hydrolase [Elusimicrobia bacterium]|nr:alpha/beta fold hydrolase [Elusimicrobiota bacterium]
MPLAAGWVAPKKGRPVVILLHGVAAARSEWNPLIDRLTEAGIGSLALDFRGHGESGGPRFDRFKTTESWLRLEADIRAAVSYVAGKGVPKSRLGLLGASIGANLAARAAAADPGLACVALLSPGLEYRGIGVDEAAVKIKRPILIAASSGDRYAFETVQYLRRALPGAASLQAQAGHGAQMLADGEFTAKLLTWLGESCRKTARTPASP